MMNAWELPSTVYVGGLIFNIRTDFRAILDILECFSSNEYEDDEKLLIMLQILYEDFDNLPIEFYEEAVNVGFEFIDMGMKRSETQRPSVMNWSQDAPLIIAAINQSMKIDIRAVGNMHWWTFLAAYMEIGESLYSTVLSIRQKIAKGAKLEKYERDFLAENKHLIQIKTPETKQIEEEKNSILRFLDGDK